MKQKIQVFNDRLYNGCKKELDKKRISKIFLNYKKENKKAKYGNGFLKVYYSPILTVLKQFIGKLKNKRILEIGYRLPLFLDYLKSQGSEVYGIDIEPYIAKENLLKMSIENISKKFLKENKNKFHAIIERITLSRLYDEKYFLETGKHRFKNKEKILSSLYQLLKPKGFLILQDDRGTIFTESQFSKIGFKKIMNEIPIIFKDKKKNLGWNVLVVYQKVIL